jgi:hypothetical protein
MMKINIKIDLQSYIGHPFWPEMSRLIDIQKESGTNRARSGSGRRKALEDYLRAIEMSYEEYLELERLANRPFYTAEDGTIMIPKKQVDGMLVTMCDRARAALRPCPKDMVRTVLRASDWHTHNKPEEAQLWERYAVVKSGTSAKLSNQRGLRRNYYVGAEPPEALLAPTAPVHATGSLDINAEFVKPETLHKALHWAGEWVGIGASRPMGWGRFTAADFELER